MITLEEKESKAFVTRLTKMLNGILKFNVDTIWFVQFAIHDDILNPIFICRQLQISVFDYLKLAFYKDKELNKNIEDMYIKYSDKKEVFVTSPTLIASMYLHRYDDSNITNTYFVIGEELKEFLKNNKVTKITCDYYKGIEFYNGDERYNIRKFIYPNDNEGDLFDKISPKKILPLQNTQTLNDFFGHSVCIKIFEQLNSYIFKAVQPYKSEDFTKEIKDNGFGYIPLTSDPDYKIKVYYDFWKFPKSFFYSVLGVLKIEDIIYNFCGISIIKNNEFNIDLIYKYLEDKDG
jgi:hypothetical protein